MVCGRYDINITSRHNIFVIIGSYAQVLKNVRFFPLHTSNVESTNRTIFVTNQSVNRYAILFNDRCSSDVRVLDFVKCVVCVGIVNNTGIYNYGQYARNETRKMCRRGFRKLKSNIYVVISVAYPAGLNISGRSWILIFISCKRWKYKVFRILKTVVEWTICYGSDFGVFIGYLYRFVDCLIHWLPEGQSPPKKKKKKLKKPRVLQIFHTYTICTDIVLSISRGDRICRDYRSPAMIL